jgi:hypothetical protein
LVLGHVERDALAIWRERDAVVCRRRQRRSERFPGPVAPLKLVSSHAPLAIHEATVVIDPTVFARPWRLAMPLRRQKDKDFELLEFACREGNRAPELSLRGEKTR